jgi:hypothetical protein
MTRCRRSVAQNRACLDGLPAFPDTALAAAQTKGRERYDGFVEALGRRLARGRKLADEVSQDFAFDSKLDTTTNST